MNRVNMTNSHNFIYLFYYICYYSLVATTISQYKMPVRFQFAPFTKKLMNTRYIPSDVGEFYEAMKTSS